MQDIQNRFQGTLLFCAFLAIAVSPLIWAPQASAQVLYGSLVGNVTDPNGAVVPSAKVTVTDQATGVVTTTTTDSTGVYQFIALQPGTYIVKISVSGFKTYERRDVPISLNNVTRDDAALEVGSIEQSVTITGEALALQTDRAETRSSVSSVELENLPVPIGRNYQQLYRTIPGISPPFNSHSIPSNPSRSLEFHVNGTSDDQNNTRIDGVSSTWIMHTIGVPSAGPTQTDPFPG
jgi:hypothetical protein